MRKETLADGVELYLGDCREILPTLGTVDAIVTDPPYGIGFSKGEGGRPGANGYAGSNRSPVIGDDIAFDPAPFLFAPDVILWGANHFASRLPHGRWLAWDKLAGTAEFDSYSDVEFAWRNGRGKDRVFSHLWKGLVRGSENNGERRQHPTQKPIALMMWCCGMVCRDSIILDPFMGSGTTGIAAAKLRRQFVGIEIEPKYFEISCKRIQAALDAPDMFVEAPKPAKQEAFEL